MGRLQTHIYLPRCLLDVAWRLASELDGVFLIVVVDDGVDVCSVLIVYRMPTRSPLRGRYCLCGTWWSCCGTKDLFTKLGARRRD